MSEIIKINIEPEVISLKISPDLEMIQVVSMVENVPIDVQEIVYIPERSRGKIINDDYSLILTDKIIFANADKDITLNLFPCSGNENSELQIKNIGSFNVLVSADDTIDGLSSLNLEPDEALQLIIFNGMWRIL